MFGRQPDGREVPARYDLVRLAMPRRVYTQSHADYLIEVFAEVVAQAANLRGMRITYEAPQMRHFHRQFRAPVRREPELTDGAITGSGRHSSLAQIAHVPDGAIRV